MMQSRLGRAFRRLSVGIGMGMLLAGTASWGKDIVIGQVAPFSGTLAATGKDISQGMQLYFDAVNAGGGVNGNKIKLVTKDDAYKADQTVALTRELITEANPLMLAGVVGTGNVDALLKDGVLKEAGLPLVGVRTGAQSLRTPMQPLVFHLRAGYNDETARIIDTLARLGIKRIAAFYQDDPFGKEGLAGVEAALKSHQLELSARGSYPKNTTEVAAAVAAISKADPQAVVMISNTLASAAFAEAYRKSGGGAQLYVVSVTDGVQVAKKIGDDAARGLVIAQVMPNPERGYIPVVREARQKLVKAGRQEKELTFTMLEGFIYGKVIAEALKRAGNNPTRESVIKALESLREFDVGGYTIDLSPTKHDGSKFVDLTVIGRGGKLLQ